MIRARENMKTKRYAGQWVSAKRFCAKRSLVGTSLSHMHQVNITDPKASVP